MHSAVIIGLGRIAWTLEEDKKREKPATHLAALREAGVFKVVGGWDIDPTVGKKFSNSEGIPTDFADGEDMIKSCRPDLVVIATWPDSHPSYLQICLDHRVPLVILEKPISKDLKQANAMIKAFREQKGNTKVIVNHERRYARDYCWSRDQIKSGRFGRILSYRARIYLGQNREPWKTLLHDGTHLIDALRFLSSTKEKASLSVNSLVGDLRQIGESVFFIGHLGQIPFSLEIGSGRDHMVFEIEANGELGSLKVGNGTLVCLESKPARWAENFRELKPEKAPANKNTGYFLNMVLDASKALSNPDYTPQSSLLDGYITMEIIQNMCELGGLNLADLQREGAADRDHIPFAD
jgi:predicted dehydrogenase